MLRTFLILTAFLSLTLSTFATEYTYRNGYWWDGDQAYTRVLIQTAGYWSHGCYYPGTSYYQYTASDYKVPTEPAYKEAGWRTQLLNLAAARDKVEGEIRKNAFEHQYYLESVKALGLEGNFRINNYGASPLYSQGIVTGHSSIQNYGVNASTQYGYSYNTIAQLYGSNDLNSLFQQSAQLTQQAQKNGAEANLGFQAAVGQEGANRAKIAEILARGQVVTQIALAMQGPSTIETKGYSFKIVPGGRIERMESNVPQDVKAGLQKKWEESATAKCAVCHTGKTPKGGWDVNTYLTMSQQEKQDKVWMRLTTDDPKLMMPRAEDGTAGQKLSQDELRVWFLN